MPINRHREKTVLEGLRAGRRWSRSRDQGTGHKGSRKRPELVPRKPALALHPLSQDTEAPGRAAGLSTVQQRTLSTWSIGPFGVPSGSVLRSERPTHRACPLSPSFGPQPASLSRSHLWDRHEPGAAEGQPSCWLESPGWWVSLTILMRGEEVLAGVISFLPPSRAHRLVLLPVAR